jgi:hypothetical protein
MKKILIFILYLLSLNISGQVVGQLPISAYPSTLLFMDEFNGTSIDATKWTITNPNPTKITFTQDEVLKLHTTALGSTTAGNDYMVSNTTFTSGYVRFSIDISAKISDGAYEAIAVFVDINNRIYLRASANKWSYVILQGGVTRYSTWGSYGINAIFKIEITAANVIRLYLRKGISGWVQQGIDQTYNIGTNKKIWICKNGSATESNTMTIDDVFVTSTDYSTCYPTFLNYDVQQASKDVLSHGGYGDSTHNDAYAINHFIATTDSAIIQNGEFRVDSSIVIPSNRTVFFKGCEPVVGSAKFDNILRNLDTTGNTNIKIIGLGNVTLNHNATNNNDGGTRTTFGKGGWQCTRYNSVYFLNSSYLLMKNITIKDNSAYALLLQTIQHSDFENLSCYYIASIGNQAGYGIDFGSNHITLKKVYGKSGDDFIALQDNRKAYDFHRHSYLNAFRPDSGCSNITIEDADCFLAGSNFIRLLTGDTLVMRNININRVNCTIVSSGWAILTGQDTYSYYPPINNDLRNIYIDSLTIGTVSTQANANFLSSPCSYIYFTNFVNNSGKPNITTNRTPKEIYINTVKIY